MSVYKRKSFITCAAVGCSMRKGTNLLSIVKMYRFPANPVRRRQWEIAVRRKDWKATSNSGLCNFHFIAGKPSADPQHPDYIPSIFCYNTASKPGDLPKLKKKTKRQKQKKVDKSATQSNFIGRPSLSSTDPDYVPNVFSFNSTKPKRRKNAKKKLVSEAENLKDNCFEEVNVNLETSADDTIQIADFSEMKDEELNMETDMQQNNTEDEPTDSYISQSSLQAEVEEELVTVKIELDEAYTEIYALKRENNKVMEQLASITAEYETIQDFASKTEKKFVNAKIELQQAYKEIIALREEKDDLQKKVSSSNVTDSIMQDSAKLHFYTGLNSVKDFQSVLALICDVDSSVRSISFETQLLMVLMRLKLNLMYSDLAYRFQTSRRTVCRICEKIIPPLEAKLDSLVKCPINNALKKNIPQCYKNTVYENLYSRLNKISKSKTKQSENEDSEEETTYSSL